VRTDLPSSGDHAGTYRKFLLGFAHRVAEPVDADLDLAQLVVAFVGLAVRFEARR